MKSGTKDRLWDLGQKALLAGATYFIVVRPVLKKLGIISDVPETNETINSKIWKQSFDPTWWKKNQDKVSLKWKKVAIFIAVNAAAIIENAKDQINPANPLITDDNEEQIYNVFRKSKSKFFISMIAASFKLKYKKELSDFLVGFLNDRELYNIKQIIEKLPDFPVEKK